MSSFSEGQTHYVLVRIYDDYGQAFQENTSRYWFAKMFYNHERLTYLYKYAVTFLEDVTYTTGTHAEILENMRLI